jgi:hypothetical protein
MRDAAFCRSPDAAQRHKRVYARLRRAMAVRCRAGVVTMAASVAVPALRSSVKNAAPRPGARHALNQPLASPVKEKYSPAAVRKHETTSMALSSCNPLSPITCSSDITENTSAAVSTQRGQFLR